MPIISGISGAGGSGGGLYLGTWDASVQPSGEPDLTTLTPDTGSFFYVSVAGTNDFGTFEVNDQVIYNGTSWQKIPNANLRIDQIEDSALSVYDLYVDANYIGATETGSTLQPFKTIPQAIAVANDGDTISVSGVNIVTQEITLPSDKSLSFYCDQGTVVGYASYDNANGLVFNQPSSSSTKTYKFFNMTVINSGDYGIYIRSSFETRIQDCTFKNNGWNGQGLSTILPASGGTLGYNSTQAEMQAFYASSNVGAGGAMRIRDTVRFTGIDNVVTENLRGMRIQDCGVNGFGYMSRNQCFNNLESGIYLASGTYDFTKGCENFIVYNNSSSYNSNNGILSVGGFNNTVSLNQVRGNWNAGLQVWSPNNIIARELSLIDNNRSPLNGIGNLGDSFGSIHIDGVGQRANSTFLIDILGCEVKDTGLGRDVTANGLIITSGFNVLTDRSRAIINIDNVGFTNQDYAIKTSCDLDKVKLTLGDMRYIGSTIQDKVINGAGYYYELPYSNHHTSMLGKVDFSVSPDKSSIIIKEVSELGVVGEVIQRYAINEVEALGDGTNIKIILKDTRKIQLDAIQLSNCYLSGSVINSIQSQALIDLNSLFTNSTPFDQAGGGSGAGIQSFSFDEATGELEIVDTDNNVFTQNITNLNVSTDAKVVSGVQQGENIILTLDDGSTVTVNTSDFLNQNTESVQYGGLSWYVSATGNGQTAGDEVTFPIVYNTFKDNMPLLLGDVLKRNQEFIFTPPPSGSYTLGVPVNPDAGNRLANQCQGDSFWQVSWSLGAINNVPVVRTTDNSLSYYSSGNDIDTRNPNGYPYTDRTLAFSLGSDGYIRLYDITDNSRVLIAESTAQFGQQVNVSIAITNGASIWQGNILDANWRITNEFRPEQGDLYDSGLLNRNAITHRTLLKKGKKVNFDLPVPVTGNQPLYFGFGFTEQSTPVGSPNLSQYWTVGNILWTNNESLQNFAGSMNFTFNTSNSKYDSATESWVWGQSGDALIYAEYKDDDKIYLYETGNDELIGSWDQVVGNGEPINFSVALFNGYPTLTYGNFPRLLFSQMPSVFTTTPYNKAYETLTDTQFAYNLRNTEQYNPLVKDNMQTSGRPWTLSLVVKFNTTGSYGYFLGQSSGIRDTNNGIRFFRFASSTNMLYTIGATDVGEIGFAFANLLPADEWIKLVFTYDGSALNSGDKLTNAGAYKVYKVINGVATLMGAFQTAKYTSPDLTGGIGGIMQIGADFDDVSPNKGKSSAEFASLSIINQCLTATQDLTDFANDPIQFCNSNSITDPDQNKIYLFGDLNVDNIAEFRNYLDETNEDDEIQTVNSTGNSIIDIDINE